MFRNRAIHVLLGAMLLFAPGLSAQESGEPQLAPELTGGVGWLNHDAPITLASLRGKIVLLDFWTYC